MSLKNWGEGVVDARTQTGDYSFVLINDLILANSFGYSLNDFAAFYHTMHCVWFNLATLLFCFALYDILVV